ASGIWQEESRSMELFPATLGLEAKKTFRELQICTISQIWFSRLKKVSTWFPLRP
ncbi:MAG: hypothetical protein IPH69_17870, partial [Bacteroidales bacterium]|nr:hypothetical protein [Bacteroidales bacterium]